MADDVEFGHVVDLTLGEPAGTELVADAAVSATSLVVDYAGDFEDAGTLVLNGEVLAYSSITYGDAETDPDTITLAAPLATAASTDDKVIRMAGGEAVTEWLFHVSQGDGHPADIPIPFEQRAMWSKADVSSPVPVFVSADLERLVEVPGRVPVLDQAFIDAPLISLHKAAATTNIPDAGAYVDLKWGGVSNLDTDAFTYDSGTGVVTILKPGLYLIILTVRWAGNTSGRRRIKIVTTKPGGSPDSLTPIGASPPDSDAFVQQSVVGYPAEVGETLLVQVQQTSGAGLNVEGDANGRLTTWQIVRLQA